MTKNKNDKPATADPFVGARAIAADLNVSVATLYRMIGRGELPPPIRVGASSRWRRSTLEAWKDARGAGQDRVTALAAEVVALSERDWTEVVARRIGL